MIRQPQHRAAGRRSKLLIGGVLSAIVSILVVFAFVWVVVPSGSRQITVSRETTYLLGPLNADGTVNYAAALNERFGEGVTPDNNAVVLILRALGPEAILADSEDCRVRAFSALGMAPLAHEGHYFVDFDTYIYSLGPDVRAADVDAALTWYYGAPGMNHGPLESPWQAEDHPVVAEWLKRNAKPLDVLVEATKRSRFFMPRVTASDPPRPSRIAALKCYLMSEALRVTTIKDTLVKRIKDQAVEN